MNSEFQGIDKIRVEGYKSIRDIEIDVRPITLLAGANSTGKSSILQPLLLMKQTLDINASSALFLPGKNVRLTSFEQIKSRLHNTSDQKFSVYLQTRKFSCKSTFSSNSENSDEAVLDSTEYRFFNPATGVANPKWTITISKNTLPDDLFDWVNKVYRGLDNFKREDTPFSPRPGACFFNIAVNNNKQGNGQPDSQPPIFSYGLKPSDVISSDIRGVIHLPGLRGTPRRSYQLIPLEHPYYRGTFSEYTASIVNLWERQGNGKFTALLDNMRRLQLATEISTKTEDKGIELHVGRLWDQSHTSNSIDCEDVVSIADVGVGVSQALPIITALIVAEPNQIVYIEQPEIHLHPNAHIGLAEAIVDAASRKVKVIVETHSATFLLALQTIIAEQKLNSGSQRIDLVLYWFTRNENGESVITPGNIDQDGTYGDWPEDFSSVTSKLHRRFLRTMSEMEAI